MNARRRKFVSEYVRNGFRPVQAVVDAGITSNRNSAHVIGYRLLRDVTVRAMIDEHIKRAKISADEVLEELSAIARADWKDFCTVKYGSNGEVLFAKLQLADKLKALELAGKHHRIWDRAGEEPAKDSNSLAEVRARYIENRSPIVGAEAATKFWDEQMAQLEQKAEQIPQTSERIN